MLLEMGHVCEDADTVNMSTIYLYDKLTDLIIRRQVQVTHVKERTAHC